MDELAKLLSILDRDGVTELVLGTGRPISARRHGQYVSIGKDELTKAELGQLFIGTPFEALIPMSDGVSKRTEIVVCGRTIATQLTRRGKDLTVRIEAIAGADPMSMSIDIDLATERPRPKRPRRATSKRPTKAPPIDESFELSTQDIVVARTGTNSIAPATAPPVKFKKPEAAVPDLDLILELPTPPRKSPLADARPPEPAGGFELSLDDAPVFELDRSPVATPSKKQAIDAPRAGDLDLEIAVEPTHTTQSISIGSLLEAPITAPAIRGAPTGDASAIVAIVNTARAKAATDIHVAANRATMIRTVGELQPLGHPLSPAEAEAILLPLLDAEQRAQLEKRGYVDFALDLAATGGRLRANISRYQGGLKGSFRIAHAKPPTLEELRLPAELAKVVSHHQGLVVFAGPSGHGKTTTLAALVDLVNSTRAHHILAIEDPVEIVHPRKKAVVSQREVGRHTTSFAAALKASLREDPDVIVIGELRDRETVEIALTAAETGHLVMATMSTPSAAKTIDRLIDMFPPDDQNQVRASLAGALRAIVAQRLLPRLDGRGVVPAVELLTGVLPLASLIRDNRLFQLPNLMQRGRSFGMIRLDDSLLELARTGTIDIELALRTAENRKELASLLRPAPVAEPAPKKGLGGMFRRDDR